MCFKIEKTSDLQTKFTIDNKKNRTKKGEEFSLILNGMFAQPSIFILELNLNHPQIEFLFNRSMVRRFNSHRNPGSGV